MSKVSRIYVDSKRMGYFISNLWNTITLIENRDEAVIFLKELLTETEIRMLAKRIQVAKMLLEGYKYEDIIPHVRVTSGTISSVNNQLQFGDGGYQKIIERLIKIEQRKEKQMEKRLSGDKPLFYHKPFGGLTDLAAQKLEEQVSKKGKIKSVESEIS